MADLVTRDPIDPEARRRALATCLWLAGAILLGGIDLPARGYASFQYAPFGIVAGLLGILYVFALAVRGVVWQADRWLRVMLIAYWVAATAMVFRVLLPPPGLVQTALALMAAVIAGVVVSRRDRDSAMVWVGVMAVTLAVLRFALVPAFEARSELPEWGPVRLGATANALREVFVAYTPHRPATQAIHFAAVACFATALYVQWNPPAVTRTASSSDPLPIESPGGS